MEPDAPPRQPGAGLWYCRRRCAACPTPCCLTAQRHLTDALARHDRDLAGFARFTDHLSLEIPTRQAQITKHRQTASAVVPARMSARAAARRCSGALGSWCADFLTQAPVPAAPPPCGNLTCSLDCNQVGWVGGWMQSLQEVSCWPGAAGASRGLCRPWQVPLGSARCQLASCMPQPAEPEDAAEAAGTRPICSCAAAAPQGGPALALTLACCAPWVAPRGDHYHACMLLLHYHACML